MMEGDLVALLLRVIRQVFADGCVKFQFALGHHLQDKHGGELFAHRGQSKLCIDRIGDFQFVVGHTKGFFVDHFSILRHQDRSGK